MGATLFLVLGLAACGFAWLLAVQMRGMCLQALALAAQDHFPETDPGAVRLAARASPMTASELQPETAAVHGWLRATYPQAVGHLKLARRTTVVAPIAALGVVLIWRFAFGGGS